MTLDEFKNYFFGATTVIGVLSPAGTDPASVQTLDAAHASRDWKDCIGGCYYVKPNYPGRSSHVSRLNSLSTPFSPFLRPTPA